MQPCLRERGGPDYHSAEMRWKTVSLVALAFIVLIYGTVLVFLAFDRDSHSASDTIRPFVITMAPVWALAVAAAGVLLQRRN